MISEFLRSNSEKLAFFFQVNALHFLTFAVLFTDFTNLTV